MASLEADFLGLKLKNPLVLASGVLGTTKGSLVAVSKSGAGVVTIKSLSLNPRKGHNSPMLVETEHGFLNAVGYSNMGLKAALEEFKNLKDVQTPVFGSIIGGDAKEFGRVAKSISKLPFKAIEIPLSCPHTPGLGLLAGHGTPKATGEITRAVKKNTKLPVIVKLSPSLMNLGAIAKAAVRAGADALNMGNTHGPGMQINLEARKPVLDFKVGGYSGPGVKPLTVRCVYDVYEATKGKVPIIGTGGVTSGLDAIELIMAGASAIGVGTAVYYRNIDVFFKMHLEMSHWMDKNKVNYIKDLVGVAHG